MSASAQGSTTTTKAVVDDKNKNGDVEKDKKPAAPLEEDDEFEDFPKEGVCTRQWDTAGAMRWIKLTSVARLDRRGIAGARRNDTFVGGELG
jgi:hypothetical protein